MCGLDARPEEGQSEEPEASLKDVKNNTDQSAFKEVIDEIAKVIEWLNLNSHKLDEREVNELTEEILKVRTRQIFVTGKGRSGLVAGTFAMRLMHIGFRVYVVGKSTTPQPEENDLLIVVSGRGESEIENVQKAINELHMKVITVTSRKYSILGKLADKTVIVPGRERGQKISHFNSLFETLALIFLDSVIACLIKKLGLTEEELEKRHAILE